jgi:hypothetical protein
MPRFWTLTMRDRPSRSLDRLIQAGIAPRRARGILREFAEHRADVIAERQALGDSSQDALVAASARLGSEQQLVANLLARSELRSWARRRPSIAFAIAPLLAFALAFVASLLVLIALVEWRKAHGDTLSAASPLIQWISAYAGVYLQWALPCAVAALLALAAMRRREASIWPCVGIAAVCFVGALTNFSVSMTPDAPSMGAGIGIGTDHMGAILMRAGSTTAPVLLPFLWVRWRQRLSLPHLS